MSSETSKASDLPWGLASALCGGFALIVWLVSCLAGVSIVAIPFAILGLVAGFIERRIVHDRSETDRKLANAGIAMSAITLLLQLLMFAIGIILAVLIFVLMFAGGALAFITNG